MPKILILSQWYFPKTWMLLRDLAPRLQRDGYEVEVLTAVPYSLAGGKIEPGYTMKFRQTEILDGVRVVRLPLFISQSRSGLGRIICYTSFGISAALIGQFGMGRPDIIFCYNLPTLIWAARLYRFFRGTKIVLMIEDLWPESVTDSGMLKGRFLNSLLEKWCRRYYRSADRLTGLSPGFKERLTERGVDPNRIKVVYNWTDESNPPIHSEQENSRFTITYAGNMGVYQGLETVIEAASILASRNVPVHFRLIGGGVEQERLKRYAESKQLPNLEFVQQIPSSEIGKELARSDALLIHLKKLDLFTVTIPGKTQSYLYAGKPILCGVAGEASRIIEEAGAGYSFEPENPSDLADAAIRMAALPRKELLRMGESGNRFYREQMSFDAGYRKITELFTQLLAEGGNK